MIATLASLRPFRYGARNSTRFARTSPVALRLDLFRLRLRVSVSFALFSETHTTLVSGQSSCISHAFRQHSSHRKLSFSSIGFCFLLFPPFSRFSKNWSASQALIRASTTPSEMSCRGDCRQDMVVKAQPFFAVQGGRRPPSSRRGGSRLFPWCPERQARPRAPSFFSTWRRNGVSTRSRHRRDHFRKNDRPRSFRSIRRTPRECSRTDCRSNCPLECYTGRFSLSSPKSDVSNSGPIQFCMAPSLRCDQRSLNSQRPAIGVFEGRVLNIREKIRGAPHFFTGVTSNALPFRLMYNDESSNRVLTRTCSKRLTRKQSHTYKLVRFL